VLNSPPKPLRISLRLQAAAIITLVLVVITVITQVVQYQRKLSLHEIQLTAAIQAIGQSFLAELEQSSTELQKTASLMATDIERIRLRNADDLGQAFFFSGIESIQFLNMTGAVTFAWHGEGLNTLPGRDINQRAASEITSNGRPQAYLECRQTCVLHAFLPTLTETGEEIIISIARDIDETIRSFSLLANVDVVVLAPLNQPAGDADRQLSHWKRRVMLVTQPDATLPLLRDFESTASKPANQSVLLKQVAERSLAITTVDLPPIYAANGVSVLLIADETDEVTAIRARAYQDIAVAVVSSLLIGLILGIALGNPMSRLLRVASAMPLLAEGKFEAGRQAIGSGTKAAITDEVDDLETAALQLTDDLETMQIRINESRQALTNMVDDLTRARAFSDRLLDTAPLIIVLHEPQGRIQRMNQFGHNATGWKPEDIYGQPVRWLIPDKDTFGMPKTPAGSADPHMREYEGSMCCADGKARKVHWMQAPIDSETGPMVLSVGLDLTQQRETESRLRWLSSHDVITQLPNREQLAHELQGSLLDVKSEGLSLALILVDIDQLQDINDAHGLLEGDRALKAVADCLKKQCANLFISRSGGDEFTLLIPGADAKSAVKEATDICRAVSALPFECHGRLVTLSVSVGVAVYPEHGTTAEELHTNAAVALGQAKRMSPGHARLVTLDEEIRALKERRVHMRGEISKAIAEDRLLLHYQPIMHLPTGRISHCEALVRMRGDDGQLIPPGSFIPVAEHTGQISAIDRLVISKALQAQTEAMQQGHVLKVSINIAAKSFEDPAFFDDFSRAVTQSGADPTQLIVEILETEAIANFDTARKILRKIREFGSHFALDDFGIGFTSFEYLRELPVSYVKIDQSFIKHLKERTQDQELVRSMNDMIHRLGILSVAEGIEDHESFEYLKNLGVDYGQGYYISRPLAAVPIGEVGREIEARLQTANET
jgi:diguanylate cyclase (GGDEF)-like protein/PAS domain S-box-containing protein